MTTTTTTKPRLLLLLLWIISTICAAKAASIRRRANKKHETTSSAARLPISSTNRAYSSSSNNNSEEDGESSQLGISASLEARPRRTNETLFASSFLFEDDDEEELYIPGMLDDDYIEELLQNHSNAVARSLELNSHPRTKQKSATPLGPPWPIRRAMGLAFGDWHNSAKQNSQHRGRRLDDHELPDDVEYTIKVFFHELRSTKSNSPKLTQEDSDELMTKLNKGFKESNFQFELVETTVTVNDTYFNCGLPPNPSINDAKRELHRGTPMDLNVYYCDIPYIGHATFPPEVDATNNYQAVLQFVRHGQQTSLEEEAVKLDGVVMKYPSEGPFGPLEVIMSLVHEVGHWFGLLHTFQDGCKSIPDAQVFRGVPSWMIVADGVIDTPSQARPSWDFDGWEECFTEKNVGIDSCPRARRMWKGPDPINNYMNYILEDCMRDFGHFTTGQLTRMLAQFETFRLQRDPQVVTACLRATRRACKCRDGAAEAQKCARRFTRKECELSATSSSLRSLERAEVLERFNEQCPLDE